MFLLNILEAVLAYDFVKSRFMKEKEVILNGNTNDKKQRNPINWTWLFTESNQGS